MPIYKAEAPRLLPYIIPPYCVLFYRLFVKIRVQLHRLVFFIADALQLIEHRIRQVAQLGFLRLKVLPHGSESVHKAILRAGILDAHEVYFVLSEVIHHQISISALFFGAVILASCFDVSLSF